MWDFQKCNQKATTQKQLNRIGCLWEKNVSHLLKSVSSDIFVVVKLLANIPAYSLIIKGHTSSSPIYMCVSSPTYLSSASLYPPHLSSWQRSLPNVVKLFIIFLNLILLSFFWSAFPFIQTEVPAWRWQKDFISLHFCITNALIQAEPYSLEHVQRMLNRSCWLRAIS